MKKTLGGDRLGAGRKMQVDLHGYERSTHDLSYVWRSTMSAGTLVPYLSKVALPGDTFDISLDADVLTHPTIGPLFGSYKVQLDVFLAPIRLYQGQLHNNALGIGLDMSTVILPKIQLQARHKDASTTDYDNWQINPSCLLNYLGIKGIGNLSATAPTTVTRELNSIPILAYWEIYKNYYSNKQEEIGAVIHTPSAAISQTVTKVEIQTQPNTSPIALPLYPTAAIAVQLIPGVSTFIVTYTGTAPRWDSITIRTQYRGIRVLGDMVSTHTTGTTSMTGLYSPSESPDLGMQWQYRNASTLVQGKPSIATFPLENIDKVRNSILNLTGPGQYHTINSGSMEPYKWLCEAPNGIPNILSNQEGLALKTYQSDLFNNWLSTEWIDGPTGINTITAIDTSGGSFTIDTLNLSKKVYDMLNRIAVSGGTYDDWLDAVYTHDRYTRAESPMYMGGLIKELVFQQVVSNSQTDTQPLGTIAGKGTLTQKHKGGKVIIKVDEPSYIIGIVSLTPRVDYSQGNNWDIYALNTMNDLHKPALDEIGFQDLITEQMHWMDTIYNDNTSLWEQHSAGKQPAWINYMTSVNETHGNFAADAGKQTGGEMFMTLNRRYEIDTATQRIKDLTTYIDPSKFNFIFAETALDAQNFWTQIAVDITARRKMSAKVMPNL